jgi:NADPH2:quinone reductase
MRAIGVTEFGGPEKLQVLDLPAPHARAGELRIDVHAATVNPTDTNLRSGAYHGGDDAGGPFVPGMDVAGLVDEVGEGVDGWQVGDRVMAVVAPDRAHGGYADLVVVPSASVVRVPDGFDLVEASTLPMNALTARVVLDQLGLEKGQTLAVTGGAGAFGGYVIQLAAAEGLRVVADAAPHDEELLRVLGADELVERGDDVAARIRALVPEGVDGFADGAVLDGAVLPAIRDGGALATIRGWDGPTERGITVHPVLVFDHVTRGDLLTRLGEQVADGTLTLRVARQLPAEEAGAAHRQLEGGGVRGRLVLDFS